MRILGTLQREGGGAAKVFEGRRAWIEDDFVVWETTVDEVLTDADLMEFNNGIQTRLDGIRDFYIEQIGVGEEEIIELPVLFEQLDYGLAVSLSPNVINMAVVTTEQATHLIVPDPEGPRVTSLDEWAEETRNRLESLGTESNPVIVSFVDVFWAYHIHKGAVHCGINSVRVPPRLDWWDD